MNKISKKIVALATMAAFVLTLVPAAAFAVEPGPEGATKVEVTKVDYNTANVTVTVGGYDLDETQNIVVWATDADGVVPLTEVEYTPVDGSEEYPGSQNWDQAIVLNNPDTADGTVSVDATFAVEGDYVLHAAINEEGAASIDALVAAGMEIGEGTAFKTLLAVGDASQYGVYKNNVFQTEASVAVNKDLTTTFKINDRYGDKTDDTLDVVIWAVNKANNQVTELTSVTSEDITGITKDGDAYVLPAVANNDEVKVQFSVAGDYYLYAGVGDTYSEAKDSLLDSTYTLVTVTDNTEVDSMDISAYINGSNTEYEMELDEDTNTYVLDLTADNAPAFRFDGIDTITLRGVASEKDGTPAKGQTINFTTTRNDVVEFVGVTGNTDSDNTDNDGLFDTTFTMQSAQNAYITITDEATGLQYDVRIIADVATPVSIDRVLTGGNILAGTDDHWNQEDHGMFTDAVQFKITDSKNDVVTRDLAANEYVIDVRTVPGNSDAVAQALEDNLVLTYAGNDVYTLEYVGTDAEAATELVEGKYEVRVALAGSEDNATVTFNAIEFGTVKDTVLDITATDMSTLGGREVEIDDEITLGQLVSVEGKYVDENGLKIDATGLVIGADGEAVIDAQAGPVFNFATKADVAANESLLGTSITVWAQNSANKQLVSRELTVVKSYNAFTLEFDKAEGAVGEDNDVTVNVVKEDGSRAQVTGTLYAFIADQSNKDAKVSLDGDNTDVTNGRGHLSIYASEETTVDVVVGVKDANNDGFYAATLEYTVGAEDPLADYTVVMTIDSSEYVVNNNVIKGDAAPYVDSNWRTMVPIRALMEAFDAEVVWDEANPDVVTINYDGDTQIVMNVGETGYTIDGEEGEMDTVPVNNNGRVYVPIRFVAEGIGFHVTPLYNANGLTASVVFQR
ncbi:MAG: copper amine oxidase N-terminal domain-containing protein [Peptococcaceae bacterium]|nr:copper amine oxidase N-terminal domain-containing protein [Peptococcaceae bacterium]